VQTVTISDTTTGATIYYTTNGTTPTTIRACIGRDHVSSTETLEAIATATGYSTSAWHPLHTQSTFQRILYRRSAASHRRLPTQAHSVTLTVNGSGSSLARRSTGELRPSHHICECDPTHGTVPAADIAAVGTIAITVQTPTPGGGTSNAWQFEVDSVSSGSTAPTITSTTETVAAGSTAAIR